MKIESRSRWHGKERNGIRLFGVVRCDAVWICRTGLGLIVVAVMRRHDFHRERVLRRLGKDIPKCERAPLMDLVSACIQSFQKQDWVTQETLAFLPYWDDAA